MKYECRTQAELDAALAEAKPSDLVMCVSDGHFTASGYAQVTAFGSAQVTASGSAQVTASGYAQVTASSYAQVTASGYVRVTASSYAQVTASGYAQVTAFGSAQVTASDSAQVTAFDSAQVRAFDSAQVTAFDSAQVTALGYAQVTAFNSVQVTASKYVVVTAHGTRTKVKGGVLIQPPPLDDPAAWCEFYGIAVKRGRIIVFKALDAELRSRHGLVYPLGATVKAEDWLDTDACGNGLHFCPTPHHALAYHLDATRYVACSVKLSEVRVITSGAGSVDKLKAPSCKVLYECDINGNKITTEEVV